MKTNDTDRDLPASVSQKLRAIQRRERALTLLQGLARTGAVLLAAMLAAMLIDLAVGWFEPGARYAITSLALGIVAVLFFVWCCQPLARKRTMVSTAREVDQTIPQLEERWSTVTELAESQDAPEVRGSERMIRKVASEAESAGASINPETVVPRDPVIRASRWLLGASAVLVLFFLINFSHGRVLLSRFWMPGSNVSLTRLTASPADAWVPKGESLTLRATVKGRVPKAAPQLFIRHASGTAKTVGMSAVASDAGAFQHSIDDVSGSFEYRIRAGDGQTPWHRIIAVERPEISAVKLIVTPPTYSALPRDERNSLPHAIRILQGSEVAVAFQSDQPLDRMVLDLGDGKSAQLTAEKDNWYQYQVRPAETFTFAAIASNKYQLENKNKPSCRVTVYEDLPPSVKVLAPSDELTVLPGEKVNVTFEAADDFGLAKAEVIVTTIKAEGKSSTVTLPVELEAKAGTKQIRKSVELDPKALGLKHGDQLNYVVQVTDTKQNPAQATAATLAQANRAAPGQAKDADAASSEVEQNAGEKSTDAQIADAVEKNEASPQATASAQLASAQAPQDQKNAPAGSRPPPHEMSMRMLDAGQSTACKPRNITVDEWAESFEGEKRKKLEIAIGPVLEQLDALLKDAEEKTDLLNSAASLPEGLQTSHAEPLAGAKGRVKEAEATASGLKSRTSGTPYAFIGLQLHNIGNAHITPAHKSLDQVLIAAAATPANIEPIKKALFHIGRAREMLADLTRTFESVKREQQIADAMQKLAKMHQLFIEDTQALLGSSQGPINSYDRKIAEVDEQFVEKLKELLEEKKKIMAELAKLLAEDPRLLRRFLAMQQLQCTSYRDQMTLLAERQKQLEKQIATWNTTAEGDRGALLPQLREEYAAGRRKLLQDATALRENMETWLPLDVKPETRPVQATLRQAENFIQLAAHKARSEDDARKTEEQALNELRSLGENVSRLDQIGSKDKARMTAYIANRLAEVESLVATHSGRMVIEKSFSQGDFPKVAEVAQHGITAETITLGQKLEATEKQVSQLSDEIAEKAALLNKSVKADIISPQTKSGEELSRHDIVAAGKILEPVVPAFALAEQTFDELMRLIIAKLDEAPAGGMPGAAPQLDSILAMLENEMKACESLGIPCRPMNVAVMSDWMKPGSGMGQGMGQAQAQAAQAQAQQAKMEADRLEKEARENARKAAVAAVKDGQAPEENAVAAGQRASAWNKLGSKLQKDLLQGRDNTPPEQYRAAIENYFKVISEAAASRGGK